MIIRLFDAFKGKSKELARKDNHLSLKHKIGDASNNWLARNRSLVLRQTPVWAQSLTFLLIGLGTTAFVVGVFFRIDEVVTVNGQLKSIGGTVEVKSPAGGQVAEVLFRDGDLVQKGQLLLRFDTREAINKKNILYRMISAETSAKDSELASLNSQLNVMRNRREVIQKRIDTKIVFIAAMQELVDQGGFQKLQFLEMQDELFSLQKQITEMSEQEYRLKLESEKVELNYNKSVDQMKNEIKSVEVQLQYQNVIAPVSGIVFDPQAQVQSVIQPAQRILSLVPQKGLFAEVNVPNQDIGYIKIGQKAKIRVDAFPFSRYGEIPAKVDQIAADALEPNSTQNFYRFPVKLSLESNSLKSDGVSIPLKAGMSITTNLKLRDKRVISLISDIFVDQTDSIRSLRQQ